MTVEVIRNSSAISDVSTHPVRCGVMQRLFRTLKNFPTLFDDVRKNVHTKAMQALIED